jgi:hypothetical protein
MRSVYLCYETDGITGISTVVQVVNKAELAEDFLSDATKLCRRVEEWIVADEFGVESGIFADFNSVDELHQRGKKRGKHA